MNHGVHEQKETTMTKMLQCLAGTAAIVSTAILTVAASAPAQSMTQENWCAIYRGGSENCHFTTQAQCLATVSGQGGFCRMSYYQANEARARR
jgi:Protein of unknown function (DUF3551)